MPMMNEISAEFNRAQALALDAKNKVLMAENDRLRKAIRWALGEQPSPGGHWFGELQVDERRKPYWWRSHLRIFSGIDEQSTPAEEE